MSKIILYSNHCPKCNILIKRLKNANIKYEEINDINLMISKGFMTMPMLEVNDNTMNFFDANKWLNEREGKINGK